MPITFKKAIRENVNLLIGLAGGTGAGKSVSALRLARGLSGDKPFCVIDTESGRGLHNADMCQPWDHGDLKAPFSPEAYTAAILAADAAGYNVIICDSFSHCWAGDQGCLDMQEAELDRMAGPTDWKKREACKLAAWIKPKMAYKAMMQKLLQIRAHLLLCFRAEQRIEMIKGADGKMQIVPKQSLTGLDGWVSVTEKSTPFELTVSLLLTADAPGVPNPIKLPNALKSIFRLDQQITEESGQRLAGWAAGAQNAPTGDRASREKGSPLQNIPAAQSEHQTAPPQEQSADATPVVSPADGAAPGDATLIKDIEFHVKRKIFDIAYDLARGITDTSLRTKTTARIDNAKAYVAKQKAQ